MQLSVTLICSNLKQIVVRLCFTMYKTTAMELPWSHNQNRWPVLSPPCDPLHVNDVSVCSFVLQKLEKSRKLMSCSCRTAGSTSSLGLSRRTTDVCDLSGTLANCRVKGHHVAIGKTVVLDEVTLARVLRFSATFVSTEPIMLERSFC